MAYKREFYEKSFQPSIVSHTIRTELTGMVQLGPYAIFGVPVGMYEDIDIWIHEFVEQGIYNLFVEYGISERISLIYEVGADRFLWDQYISHIIAASTGMSGLDGQTVDADVYWEKFMERYSQRISSEDAKFLFW